MRVLPITARLYLVVLWAIAALLTSNVVLQYSWNASQLLWVVLGLVVLVAADIKSVVLKTSGGEIAATVADAPRMILVSITGPIGVLAVIGATLITDTLERRQWFKTAFNSASRAITYLAMVAVYQWLHPANAVPFGGGLWGVAALLAVALTSYGLNTLLLATMIAFVSHQRIGTTYRSSFGSVHPVHLFTTPLGALCAAIAATEPWLLVVGLVPLLMAQRWFATLAELQQETLRAQELANEQSQLYAQLQQQQEELIRAEKLSALGTFSSGIAHEFNNLLAGVLGHAQLGLASHEQAEKDYSLEVVLRACERGRSITDSLLTFARRREPRRVLAQVRDGVDDTLKLVEHDLTRAGIQVERRLQPVPATLCDLGQLVQVLLNLITNAVDAMRPQGRGTLTIELAQRDGQIELAVADTGGGMPDEVREHMFQPFYTTKAPGKGTGLGMALCYGIVEQHGGTITVTSTVGHGTTVTIRLPILGESLVESLVQPELPPLRMLIVDDDRPALMALADLLTRRHHTVQTAASGEAALSVYRPGMVDVVLCDAQMPLMDGVRFVQQLREIDLHVPIVVLTGNPDGPAVTAMRVAGISGVIAKPAGVDEILAMLRTTLSYSGALPLRHFAEV